MATYRTWAEALEGIDGRAATLSDVQADLARTVGLSLPKDLPRVVAAVRLQQALAVPLGLQRIGDFEPSPYQEESLLTLSQELGLEPINAPTYGEASAWLVYLRLLLRRKYIAQLKLNGGDIIRVARNGDETFEEVSSIADTGRVFLKGGGAAGAWPDQVSIGCRREDVSAEATSMRDEARNNAAARLKLGSWSFARRQDLESFLATQPLGEEEIDALESVVDGAEDEKPIQKFIEAHPHVLTAVLPDDERFCIPQKSLGGEYFPDFLLGEVNSLGISWVLVELETPRSSITLKTQNELDKYARKGRSQIKEWRQWLQENLYKARGRPAQGGLGLYDIRPQSRGLLLVGRRSSLLQNTNQVRHQAREDENIVIHTYDWLIEVLRARLVHEGMPRSVPGIFKSRNT